jgi:hypothetical protein
VAKIADIDVAVLSLAMTGSIIVPQHIVAQHENFEAE